MKVMGEGLWDGYKWREEGMRDDHGNKQRRCGRSLNAYCIYGLCHGCG